MAVVPKETLKGYFNDGDIPVESEYEDLIDSLGTPSEAQLVTGDWNDYRTSGFYRGNQLANGPTSSWYYVLVIRHNDSYVSQEAIYYYTAGSPKKYIRRCVGGTWEAWERVHPAQWGNITGKPSTYPPSGHTHGGGDITSQVSDSDKVDSLHASQFVRSDANDTKTGDLRMSGGLTVGSTSDLAANGEVRATSDIYPKSQEAGVQYRNDTFLNPSWHFNVSSRPSGWAMWGSMADSYSTPSHVTLSGATGVSFFYRTLVNVANYFCAVSQGTLYTGSNCGVRLDRSADPNYYYMEYVVQKRSGLAWELFIKYRSGSGDIAHSVSGGIIYGFPTPFHLQLSISGSRWSSWGVSGLLRSPGSPAYMWAPNNAVSGLSWTPNRMGLKQYASNQSWEAAYFDYFEY
jgi:hypothetical protein